MDKRVYFRQTWLPWLLVAPQLAIVGVFFFWPAAQALYQSMVEQDAFGTSMSPYSESYYNSLQKKK